jgi:hypothetical protein
MGFIVFVTRSLAVAVDARHGVAVEGFDDKGVDQPKDGDGEEHGEDGTYNAGTREVAAQVGHTLGDEVHKGLHALLHDGGHVLVDLQGREEGDEARAADHGAEFGEEGHDIHGVAVGLGLSFLCANFFLQNSGCRWSLTSSTTSPRLRELHTRDTGGTGHKWTMYATWRSVSDFNRWLPRRETIHGDG